MLQLIITTLHTVGTSKDVLQLDSKTHIRCITHYALYKISDLFTYILRDVLRHLQSQQVIT